MITSKYYCCLYIFEAYLNLAELISKTSILYYGVNTYGRGLVGAV